MNAWLDRISKTVSEKIDAVEEVGFAVQEFAALFRVRAGGHEGASRLRESLKRHDTTPTSVYGGVPGLHTARWVLVEALERPTREQFYEKARPRGTAAQPALPSGPLFFACVHDGDTEDFLYALVERCRMQLDEVLAHCEDFPVGADTAEYVRRLLVARKPANYFFDDIGSPRSEVRRALALRRRFVEFIAENQVNCTAATLRSRFAAFARGEALGFPFALASPFEFPTEDEGKWIRRAAELAHAQVLRDTRDARHRNSTAPARRDVHAKHHGFLEAEFLVRDDLDPRLRRGIFVPGARYPARLRFSNTASKPQRDWMPDGRGLALKLIGVGGRSLLDPAIPDGIEGVERGSTQDFLMVSHPTFFIKDPRDYAVFRSILGSRGGSGPALRFAAFWARRPREAWIFARTLLRVIANPLYTEYHSMLACLLGPDLAVKYSIRPKRKATGWPGPSVLDFCSPDYLKEALRRSLDPDKGGVVSLELFAHLPDHDCLSVEDPRVDWSRAGARRVPVATITIHKQDGGSEERMKMGERAIFTPWHTRPEHRPLGGLNRARLAVYQASAVTRSQLNS